MPSEKSEGPADRKDAAWTVLVYLAGDNNLTEEMAWALQELKKTTFRLNAAAKDPIINVVAHFDPQVSRGRRYDFSPPLDPKEDGSRDGNLHRYEGMVYTAALEAQVQQAGSASTVAQEENKARSNQLATFLQEQVRRLPHASDYFLVLSGHGSGAVGDFLSDLDPATSLSIPELALILRDGRDTYWKKYKECEPDDEKTPKRISVLGMDSCLMSNAEVCYEIRDHARFLVASEGWVSRAGWPYHRVLEACLDAKGGVDPDPRSVATRVAQSYSLFYQDYEISGMSTDIAVCDLARFRDPGRGSLVALLRAFSTQCIRSFDNVYVHDVLAGLEVGEKEAYDLRESLCGEVAGLLHKGDDEKTRDLASKLSRGSAAAKEALRAAPVHGKETASRLKVLRELLEAVKERYDFDEDPPELKENWPLLWKEIEVPTSLHRALSVVTVLREFDPGVLEALELIEAQEQKGMPETKKARASLQKLHQVQWLLELKELAKADLVADINKDLGLLNAMVAARWQAQSFKGGVYVDLFDLCRCLQDHLHKSAPAECKSIQEAMASPKGSGIVLTSLYTGAAFQHAHGLSVYFPCQVGDYAPAYDHLQFAGATGWGRFVRSFLRATRRERREEQEHWATARDHVLRFVGLEIDPLESDGIEARIVGVVGPAKKDERPPGDKRTGVQGKIRTGVQGKIRTGVEGKIRTGVEGKIRGDGSIFVWGNPPDGFFRQRPS